jgi:hypothetical protein
MTRCLYSLVLEKLRSACRQGSRLNHCSIILKKVGAVVTSKRLFIPRLSALSGVAD